MVIILNPTDKKIERDGKKNVDRQREKEEDNMVEKEGNGNYYWPLVTIYVSLISHQFNILLLLIQRKGCCCLMFSLIMLLLSHLYI